MEILNIKKWGLPGKWDNPILVSGPCSAETHQQVLKSCLGAAKCGASVLRAGIWKPRTRPGSFQGIGSPGLPWIREAGDITGLPVTVEVAAPSHVEKALKCGIDVLWIGARSSANPFTIQEIANALEGVDVPIFIKNPVNPDLELWIGAIERFYRAGLRKIALIHRGFSVFKAAPYRNKPMWQIPIEMRRRYPKIEILCDPSHIAGTRALLLPVAQKALDLDFNGLMVECHINPDQALSDAKQQVNPDELKSLLVKLVKRHADIEDPDFLIYLENLRHEIDDLDHNVIELLARRMRIAKEIGMHKKEQDITILQLNRWTEIFENRVRDTINSGLSEAFAKELIQCIHNESIRQQHKVMNRKG